MRYSLRLIFVLLIMMAFLALSVGSFAQAREDRAVVTMVNGKVYAYAKGSKKGKPVRKNDRLSKNQEVKVSEKSRVEITFPDGTVMRFAEKSTVKMEEILYEGKTGSKKVKVDLGGGKLWANVRKLTTPDSKVEVKTVNAVAGVRGTVYRVNVDEDNSTMVKVYDGQVSVSGAPREVPKPATEAGGPVPVPGPHEVPPPYHEVTMEEWHVIVKSFQQIRVSSQGVPSQPEDFNPQQDRDDWVTWNQERDKLLRF
jgi:hypothetical protein